jgi:fermentation-respiration switch protein FrsA (DUF1100 family)
VPRTPSRVRAVVVVTTIAVLGGLVVLWSLQRRLTYFPAGPPPPVEDVLPGAEEVAVTTADGLRLHAWWAAAGPTAVLVLHGNGGNRAGRAPLAAALRDHGLSVLLLDYRGYGGNPGTPSQAGLLDDARAAADWLHARRDVEDVVYFGESLGAAVAVGLARERPARALVLRSPFTSLADVARTHYGPVPGWLLRDPYPAVDWIDRVTAPVLVVAGEQDTIVPVGLSRRLAEAADELRRFVTVPGADHNDRALLDGDGLLDAVVSFLADQGVDVPPGPAG